MVKNHFRLSHRVIVTVEGDIFSVNNFEAVKKVVKEIYGNKCTEVVIMNELKRSVTYTFTR